MPCLVVGHRGAGDLVPENTLASLAKAVEIGVNELEIDLRLSKDGHIVVIHDATVDRTTNGQGEVSDLTLAELRSLDAGDGHRIPTFAEVLDATSISLQVEIKDPRVIDPLVELLASRPGDIQRLAPTSFDVDSVGRVAALLPSTTVGLISKTSEASVIDAAIDRGARRVLVGSAQVTRDFVDAAHARGLRVDLWPIASADQVRRAVEIGADGFTTDDPRIVAEAGFQVGPEGLVPVPVRP